MRKPMFALLALAISLFGTQCWAQDAPCSGEGSVTCAFSPGFTRGVYEFFNDGRLVVEFDTVLGTGFSLTVTVTHPLDSSLQLDPSVFPSGTHCVNYPTNSLGTCTQYDFTGNVGAPPGLPVKNKNYKRLITLTLGYSTGQIVHNPAFGHAPGEITTFTEDIITGYSTLTPSFPDPTMVGKTPDLSSVIALDEPGNEAETFCFVSPLPNQTFSAALVKEIEVSFQFSSDPGGSCPISGTPIRDKTARFSLSTKDPSTGNVVFPPLLDKEEGNKFHWYNRTGLNEFDLSTVGLKTNVTYTITVFSNKFSPPQNISFTLTP